MNSLREAVEYQKRGPVWRLDDFKTELPFMNNISTVIFCGNPHPSFNGLFFRTLLIPCLGDGELTSLY